MEEQGGTVVRIPETRTLARGTAWSALDGRYQRPARPPEEVSPDAGVEGPVAQELMRLRREVARLQADNARLERDRDRAEERFTEALELGRGLADQRNAFIEKLADSESRRRQLRQGLQEARLELATAGTINRRDRAVIARANRQGRELSERLEAIREVICRVGDEESGGPVRERLLSAMDEGEARGTARWELASLTFVDGRKTQR